MCISVELNHRDVPSEAVFTNSEISLKHIDVYGFDFDYTLLQYTPELHRLIYTAACKRLVDKLSVRLHNKYTILYGLRSRLASEAVTHIHFLWKNYTK